MKVSSVVQAILVVFVLAVTATVYASGKPNRVVVYKAQQQKLECLIKEIPNTAAAVKKEKSTGWSPSITACDGMTTFRYVGSNKPTNPPKWVIVYKYQKNTNVCLMRNSPNTSAALSRLVPWTPDVTVCPEGAIFKEVGNSK